MSRMRATGGGPDRLDSLHAGRGALHAAALLAEEAALRRTQRGEQELTQRTSATGVRYHLKRDLVRLARPDDVHLLLAFKKVPAQRRVANGAPPAADSPPNRPAGVAHPQQREARAGQRSQGDKTASRRVLDQHRGPGAALVHLPAEQPAPRTAPAGAAVAEWHAHGDDAKRASWGAASRCPRQVDVVIDGAVGDRRRKRSKRLVARPNTVETRGVGGSRE
mmetsp:Transcript_21509/g.71080  ORF Transcript_21509/g.71080 Transcript_21509/m.71080 type:complete len:221 (-) Transcript_21509:64-726(-)